MILLQLLWILPIQLQLGYSHSLLNKDNLIWSQFKNDSWVCGDNIKGTVQCTEGSNKIKLSRCYCIYYDQEKDMSQFGNCISTCFNPQFHSYIEIRRLPVKNASQFNDGMCVQKSQWAHVETYKTGRFCGRCQNGYGLSAYSYDISTCIPCRNVSHKNWLMYFTVALFPLTVFYVIVVLFKINFTSSKLNGVIIVVQIVLSPFNLQLMSAWMISGTMAGSYAPFGFFNLDFFRGMYPAFCLGDHLSALHLVALDYIPAIYPFFLIFITYILIKLYDNDYYHYCLGMEAVQVFIEELH